MKISLPNLTGELTPYQLVGRPIEFKRLGADSNRTIFAAAHVVADPLIDNRPSLDCNINWQDTLKFRRHLTNCGLGIAEAMDTAQRGAGLNWENALELIKQTKTELPDALVFNGCGTDHLTPRDCDSLEKVYSAYIEQIDAVQKISGRIIIMASRALVMCGNQAEDYIEIYGRIIAHCEKPVILHWLGEMFDPALLGYWGAQSFESAMDTVLTIISNNVSKVDGIKISLLDKQKEITMRRRLPDSVKMYTGDDFNYPELIAGDEQGYSHGLLGIFDPLAKVASTAVELLRTGNKDKFFDLLEPTLPLARLIFKAPTQHYKTGVVFLAWLNGLQDHFVMLNGAQSMRSLPHFVECFKLADQANVLENPDMAIERMNQLLKMYGM